MSIALASVGFLVMVPLPSMLEVMLTGDRGGSGDDTMVDGWSWMLGWGVGWGGVGELPPQVVGGASAGLSGASFRVSTWAAMSWVAGPASSVILTRQ